MALEFHRMTIENFKAFRGRHVIDLSGRGPGLVFVAGVNKAEPSLGANGAAKSTLWDALFWCLYGKPLRGRATEIEPWEGSKEVRVSVDLASRGTKATILRSRRPNELRLLKDVENRVVEQAEIDALVGLREDEARYSIIIGQFGALFLELGPEKQSQIFTDILNLDVWLRATRKSGEAAKSAQETVAEVAAGLLAVQSRLAQAREVYGGLKVSEASFEKQKQEEIKIQADAVRVAKRDLAEFNQTEKKTHSGGSFDDVDNAVETLRKKRDEIREVIFRQRNVLAPLEERRRSLEKLHKKYGTLGAVCPECGQAVSKQHLAKRQRETFAELDDVLREIGSAEKTAKTVSSNLAALEKELGEKMSLKEALKRQAEQNRQDELRQARQLEALSNAVTRAEDDLKRSQKQANPYGPQLEELDSKIKDLGNACRKLELEKTECEREARGYAFWVDGFREIRLSLIEDALVELEIAANRCAGCLGLDGWQLRFATERTTKAGSLSLGFTVLVMPPGGAEQVPLSSYSGGEEQRLKLAVTLALSEVLLARAGVDPNIEIYDEPTQHLSAEGIDDLLEHLAERARQLSRRIYFVDHRMLDHGAFDEVMLVQKDSKGSHVEML